MADESKVGKVEVLKVWYCVFCTVADAYNNGEYTQAEFAYKMLELRQSLARAVPEVEEEMARYQQ